MKTLLVVINFQLLLCLGFAQTTAENYQPQNYADSIALAKSMIQTLEFDFLEGLRASYRAQNVHQDSKITDDVMNLLDQRYQYLSARRLFNTDLFIPDNIIVTSYNDSLHLVKLLIEDLGFSQVPKIVERYRYLYFKQPELVNKEVLSYLEEKFKAVAHEN